MPEANLVQQMLTLSMLAYQGYTVTVAGSGGDALVRREIARGLAETPTVSGRWVLAWGPARWRPSVGMFDDALMFVARDVTRPTRLAVVIRGTNPVSALDWLLGDFWVARQTPWSYGDPAGLGDAKISYSTALGLSVLQQLRSGPPDDAEAAWSLGSLVGEAGRLWRRAEDLLRPVEAAARAALTRIRRQVRADLQDLCEGRLEGQTVERRIERLAAEIATGQRQRILEQTDAAVATTLSGGGRFDLLRLLEGDSRIRDALGEGVDMLTWLRSAATHVPAPLEVFVTGHSKGGAMAQTVAQWLSDTQGTAHVRPQESWNPQPDRRATIHCYAFAGPTPGNAAFATRCERTLGTRNHRIANHRDTVTHAWEPGSMAGVPALYPPPVLPVLGLDQLATQVAGSVEPLGYRHVNAAPTRFQAPLDPRLSVLPLQIAHQHSQAYLDQFGLGDVLPTTSVFDPIR